jgi:hypothetical protein
MTDKTRQLPRGRKVEPTSAKRNNVPLYLAGGALLLILIGVLLLTNLRRGSSGSAGLPQVTGQPRLALDRDQIDFGKVPIDKPVKATFRLSNVGDRPLQILNQPIVEVKQGC